MRPGAGDQGCWGSGTPGSALLRGPCAEQSRLWRLVPAGAGLGSSCPTLGEKFKSAFKKRRAIKQLGCLQST